MTPTLQTLAARVDLLAIVTQELARALSPAQAAQVAECVRRRVAELADGSLGSAADPAMTADLAVLE